VNALSLLLALAIAAEPPPPGLESSYLYGLSTSTGAVRSTWASLSYDPAMDEVFASQGVVVAIFNKMGMQVHDFGGDGSLGIVIATAVMEDGDVVVISAQEGQRVITRCDYRGEILGRFELSGLPEEIQATFRPDLIAYRAGKLYLGESSRMNVVVADTTGKVLAHHDLKKLLQLDEQQVQSSWVRGMSVDRDGRLLVTLPLLFKVAIISPDRTFKLFGSRGSTPGRFNIIGKMVSDERGFYYLTDTLRCVVMVFDPDLKFLGEFGYRGDEPSNLISPLDIAVGNGKVIVAQAGNRGVSVFKVTLPPPPPPTSAPATPPPTAAPR
jgi:hypothetical protein